MWNHLFLAVGTLVIGLTVGAGQLLADNHDPKTLTFASDVWCPYSCEAEAAQPGIGVELLKKIYEPLGYTVHHVVMPWSRAIESARTGTIDGVIAATKTDTPDFVFPNKAISMTTDNFFVRADSPLVWKGIKTLEGQHIGIIKGYTYGTETQNFLDKADRVPGVVQTVGGDDALDQNIRKLLAGRIDVVIEDKIVFEYTFQKQNLADKIKPLGDSLPNMELYIAFSPTSPRTPQLVKEYNKQADLLHHDDLVKQIISSYSRQTQ